MDELDPEVIDLVAAGRKIEAIKLLRERAGMDLASAKALVDELAALDRGEALAEPEAAWTPEIDELLRLRRKIDAIRIYRERTGRGLKESKDAIELRMVELGIQSRPSKCFIATAAFGTADEPAVRALRRYRGRVLRRCASGRAAIALYECFSPPISIVVGRSALVGAVVRRVLVPMSRWAARRTPR